MTKVFPSNKNCETIEFKVFIFYSLHIFTAALLHELLNIYFDMLLLSLICKGRL